MPIALVPNHYYHIYNRGNNGIPLFYEDRNYAYFLKLYAHHVMPIAETYAYCLMNNHFHLLVKIKTAPTGAVSETAPVSPAIPSKPVWRYFNNFFIAYTKAINKAYERSGSLFEKPYRRKLVDNQAYFNRLIVYIHHNPQHHQFVDDFRDWKWSSYTAAINDGPTNVQRAEMLSLFGGRADFVDAHRDLPDDAAIEPLRDEDFV